MVLADLLHRIILAPIALSLQQIYLVSLQIVITCNKRNIDINELQWDELLTIAIKKVKKRIFRQYIFKFYCTFTYLQFLSVVNSTIPDCKANNV